MSPRLLWMVCVAGCGRVGFDASRDGGTDGLASDTSLEAPITSVCSRAIALPDDGRIGGDSSTFTGNTSGTCSGADDGAGSPDIVYAVTVAQDQAILVYADLPTDTFDTMIYIRSSCDDPNSQLLDCDQIGGYSDNAQQRTGPLAAGTYYVIVDGNGATSGIVDGRIEILLPQGAPCPAKPRERCGPELACTAGMCQPSTCTGAIAVPFAGLPTTVDVDTPALMNRHSFQASFGECSQGGDEGIRAPEAILQITGVPDAAMITISTDGAATDYDTIVYIRDSCNGNGGFCNDDVDDNIQASTVHAGPLTAGDYYVFIDGFATNSSGHAHVTITSP